MSLLRAGLFNLWFFGLTFVMGLGGLFVRAFAPARAHDYARRWVRLVLGGLRVICGIGHEVIHPERLPRGPALVASQHQSAFDTLVWMLLVPRASYVMKRELTRIPLFGPMLLAAGQIPVDRTAGAAALRALLREAERAREAGRHIIIFPEGTRTPPGERVPLQPGVAALAAYLRVPVIPVATDSGLHWGRRAFRKHPGTIHLALGAPIDPGLPRAALLAAIEQAWREEERHLLHPAAHPVDKSVGGSQPKV
jgi:1-acyl-sn-glycerol-3-phosphate acyltransferase